MYYIYELHKTAYVGGEANIYCSIYIQHGLRRITRLNTHKTHATLRAAIAVQ